MKTIKQRAVEYTKTLSADIGVTMQREMEAMCKQLVAIGYIAGAKEEHEYLTRWNSPDELPALDEDGNARFVLMKFTGGDYAVGFYNHYQGNWSDECDNNVSILGWREIHE